MEVVTLEFNPNTVEIAPHALIRCKQRYIDLYGNAGDNPEEIIREFLRESTRAKKGIAWGGKIAYKTPKNWILIYCPENKHIKTVFKRTKSEEKTKRGKHSERLQRCKAIAKLSVGRRGKDKRSRQARL